MILVSISLAADYATSKDDIRTFDGSAENISAIAGTTAILPCSVDLSNSDPSKEVCFKITVLTELVLEEEIAFMSDFKILNLIRFQGKSCD